MNRLLYPIMRKNAFYAKRTPPLHTFFPIPPLLVCNKRSFRVLRNNVSLRNDYPKRLRRRKLEYKCWSRYMTERFSRLPLRDNCIVRNN